MIAQAPQGVPPGERRSQPIVLPLLLIAAGVMFLMLNLGYVSWDVARGFLRFWPVIFILLGLEALITRRVPWGALILAIVLAAVIGNGAWDHMGGPWRGNQGPFRPRPLTSVPHQQTIDAASRGIVTFSTGGGDFRLHSLNEPGLLARWQAPEEDDSTHQNKGTYRVKDGVGRLEIDLPNGRFFGPLSQWISNDTGSTESGEPTQIDLQLSTGLPLEIEGKVGASGTDIDLTDLMVSRFSLDAGASNGIIRLPANSSVTTALLRGGASSLTIYIPENVGAKIQSEGGLSNVHVDPARFTTTAGRSNTTEYQTQNYASSPNRLDLTMRLGATNVDIR